MPRISGLILSGGVMITAEQAEAYLKSLGVDTSDIPDFVINGWVEIANSINDCLDKYYSAATATLIQCYLISLLEFAQSNDKYVSSQTGPNGASRSFKQRDFEDQWKARMSLITGLDTHGCTSNVLPTDPTVTAFGGLWVAKGGCMCGG